MLSLAPEMYEPIIFKFSIGHLNLILAIDYIALGNSCIHKMRFLDHLLVPKFVILKTLIIHMNGNKLIQKPIIDFIF